MRSRIIFASVLTQWGCEGAITPPPQVFHTCVFHSSRLFLRVSARLNISKRDSVYKYCPSFHFLIPLLVALLNHCYQWETF